MLPTIIVHKGEQIVYGDYSSCKKPEEILAMLNESERLYIANPNVRLGLAIVGGVNVNTEIMGHVKSLAQRVLNHQVERGALVGVTGLKKVLLNGLNLVTKIKWVPFDTKEEALEYLTR